MFCGLLVYQQHTTESGKHIDDLPKQSAQTSIQVPLSHFFTLTEANHRHCAQDYKCKYHCLRVRILLHEALDPPAIPADFRGRTRQRRRHHNQVFDVVPRLALSCLVPCMCLPMCATGEDLGQQHPGEMHRR